jgi:lysophospholipase L1-like esterase
MTRSFCAVVLLGLLTVSPCTASAADKLFELLDGDRVALIGGTFIEREQVYSYLETLLRTRWPDRNITFRNLGWAGDNVFGASRGYFEGADAGFARLRKFVHELKPTVIFIGYGMTESFDGDAGLPTFRSGLEKMLDMLKDLNARETVLIGPIRHENLGPPLPDPAEHNKWLRSYADAMKDVANQRGHRFVDLYDLTRIDPATPALTANGIHLTQAGYWQAAVAIEFQLGVLQPGYDVSINEAGEILGASGRFEKVRQLAIRKNLQFFNQWRPANETYIFGFRQHEQGKNAAEMPQFSKTIEALENEITKAAQSAGK